MTSKARKPRNLFVTFWAWLVIGVTVASLFACIVAQAAWMVQP
jgi:hypothetical protein